MFRWNGPTYEFFRSEIAYEVPRRRLRYGLSTYRLFTLASRSRFLRFTEIMRWIFKTGRLTWPISTLNIVRGTQMLGEVFMQVGRVDCRRDCAEVDSEHFSFRYGSGVVLFWRVKNHLSFWV